MGTVLDVLARALGVLLSGVPLMAGLTLLYMVSQATVGLLTTAPPRLESALLFLVPAMAGLLLCMTGAGLMVTAIGLYLGWGVVSRSGPR